MSSAVRVLLFARVHHGTAPGPRGQVPVALQFVPTAQHTGVIRVTSSKGAALASLRDALAAHEGPDGIVLDSGIWIVTARR